MAEDPKTKKTSDGVTPKVFDVAHPSKNTPSNTSKPVIVGHKNIIKKDPMVSASEPKKTIKVDSEPKPVTEQVVPKAEPEEILDKPKRELTLAPLSDEKDSPSEETPVAMEKAAEAEPDNPETEESTVDNVEAVSSEEGSTEEDAGEKTSQEDAPPTDDDEFGNTETAKGTLSAVVGGVNTKKERIEEDSRQAKIDAEIEGLINSKKYNVKIHAPAKTRNLRWLLLLLIVALLAGVAWYLTMGPGKDLWINTNTTQPSAVTEIQSTVAPVDEPVSEESLLRLYEDKDLGLSFSYPENWEVVTTVGEESPIDILPANPYTTITINAPVESVQTADIGEVKGVEAQVFLQTKIFIEKDAPADKIANFTVVISNCTTEDIVIAENNLKLSYLDVDAKAPNIRTVSVSPSNCEASDGGKYNIPIQFQLKENQNRYTVESKLIYSEQYLRQNGTTEQDAVDTAQQEGVLVAKDAFQKSINYQAFEDILKSFKEV